MVPAGLHHLIEVFCSERKLRCQPQWRGNETICAVGLQELIPIGMIELLREIELIGIGKAIRSSLVVYRICLTICRFALSRIRIVDKQCRTINAKHAARPRRGFHINPPQEVFFKGFLIVEILGMLYRGIVETLTNLPIHRDIGVMISYLISCLVAPTTQTFSPFEIGLNVSGVVTIWEGLCDLINRGLCPQSTIACPRGVTNLY